MGQRRKLHRFLCTHVLGLAVGLGAGFGPAAAESQEVMKLADVERGQTGYGLSVFEGDQPERVPGRV